MSEKRPDEHTQELLVGEPGEPGTNTGRMSRQLPPPPPPAARARPSRGSQASPPRPSAAGPPPAPPRAAAPRPSATSAAPPPGASADAEPRDLGDDALIERMREELGREPDPHRAARLHYDMGVLLERSESKPARAADHYRKAAELRPDHLPSLTGARRTLLALGRYGDVLPLLDAEQKLSSSPADRARLAFEKGRLLELRLGRADDALAAYREGLQLDTRNIDLLRATARAERRAERWDALDRTLEQLAQAIEHDPAFRAAVIAERARLADVRKRDPVRTSELYFAALTLDPDVGGAAEAIKRLGHTQGHFEQLLQVFEQEALRSSDPDVAAAAHARMAELFETQIGDLDRAIAAQEAATSERPEDRTLLEQLCELYARKGRTIEQVAVLERLRELARNPAERAALSTRMAEIAEGELQDNKRAEGYWVQALAADPAHAPALQGLAALYARSGDQHGLLAVHARELETLADGPAKAELLARMGALWEGGACDLEQAAQHYTRALGCNPEHDGALRALDRILPGLDRHAELVLAYEQVIDKLKSPEQAIAYLFRIGALYEDRLDEPKGAIAAYERVLRHSPDHHGALHALQRAALRAGDHERALRALQREAKLIAPAPRAAELQIRAADLLAEQLNNPQAAIAELEQVLKEHPKHALASTRLCTLYRGQQRWEPLLALLSRRHDASAAGEPRAALAIEIAQLCELRLGRVSEAIAYYGRALAVQPGHAAAFAALTALLRKSAKWSELATALETRAKGESDNHERARRYCELGRLLEERLNDPVRALEAYARALEAQPGCRPAIDARTRVLWTRADLPRLVKALHEEAAQTTDPRLALAALERAAALEADAIGDIKAAQASYRELLERAPHHVSALLAAEALGIGLRDKKALAANYAAQAAAAEDDRVKVSALRDLAQAAGSPEEAAEAYRALLALRADDPEALAALADQALAGQDVAAALAHKAKLAQLAGDRALAASHHLAIAAQIEAGDAAQALAAYRTALALDPESLPAVRGLTRAALAFALPEALSEAARAEARVTRDVGLAVDLLLRAADLRARSAELAGAAADVEHALEHDPGHVRAAELLTSVLTRAGEQARLAELLARAAEATPDPNRRADLYTQVARLRAEHMRSIPAAVSAAERALAAKPDHAGALLELGRYLEAMERWEQAAEVHERRGGAARDAGERASALLAVAAIAADRLRDTARAHKHLRLVLAAQPDNRSALVLQAKLFGEAGKHAEALGLLRKLVETCETDAERAKTLLELARAEEREGQDENAEQALWQALALEGPGSDAEREYRERIGRHASHVRFIEALGEHAQALRERGESAGRTLRAIAQAQAEGLNDRAQALATLQEAVRSCPEDVELAVEYAGQLSKERKPEAAITLLRAQIARAPERPELWQALSAAQRAAGRSAEAVSSALPLLLLDAASGEQRVVLQTRKARPADMPALFNDALVRELDGEGVLHSAAATLAQTLAPVLAKLRPVELASYGVSRRDRLAEDSDHSLRLAVDRVARILGAPECDVYVHELASTQVELGLGEVPALLVPRAALSLPKSKLVFSLARPLFCLRYELAAVAALPAPELATLLAGAVRRQQPGYGEPGLDADDLDEAARAISKAVPWLARKKLDDAAAALAADPDQDLEAFCADVERVAARAALLLCDDVVGALDLLRAGSQPVLANPIARDLLQLWASELAVRYRQRLS